MTCNNGLLFEDEFITSLKEKFYCVYTDPNGEERLFFDNSGGSLRLRAAVDAKAALEAYPDCPERNHPMALELKSIVERGTRELLELVFAAKSGALISELTASQTMFQMVGIIMENVPGTNAVVSVLEHPSAFDAVEYYCKKTNKELRVIPANPATGEIEPEAVARLVDENTCLLSVTSASNVCGTIMDLPAIVEASRKKQPSLYIISDAVQHAPHCPLDAEALQLDGVNFAPYKFFGVRGCGFAYVSDRVAALPHHRLLAKPTCEFALGTPSPGNFAAALAVIDYVCSIGAHFLGAEAARPQQYAEGMRRIHLQERALLHRMLEGTESIPGLRHIHGISICADALPLHRRDLIAAISMNTLDCTALAAEYRRRGVIACERTDTSMYSRRIVTALQSVGVVRVSPLHCHAPEDIDRFLSVTADIASSHKI